ncbi:MAG: DUF4226 domain-containing protein [Mycobacterium sp.]
MSRPSDPTEDARSAAVATLAERGQDLSDADRALSDLLCEAHELSATAVARLDQISAHIESTVRADPTASPVEAREFSRLLLDKHREIIAIVEQARADVEAKTIALQALSDRYRLR